MNDGLDKLIDGLPCLISGTSGNLVVPDLLFNSIEVVKHGPLELLCLLAELYDVSAIIECLLLAQKCQSVDHATQIGLLKRELRLLCGKGLHLSVQVVPFVVELRIMFEDCGHVEVLGILALVRFRSFSGDGLRWHK